MPEQDAALKGRSQWQSLTFGRERVYKPLVRGNFRFPGAIFHGLNTQTQMFQEGPHTAVFK